MSMNGRVLIEKNGLNLISLSHIGVTGIEEVRIDL